jgi:hypothetical protein
LRPRCTLSSTRSEQNGLHHLMVLAEIWSGESNRLYYEALAEEARTGIFLTPQERWKLTTEIPECIEHNRLSNLQEPHYVEMDKLVRQMWATPAHTPEGRRAKVLVLLGCIRSSRWCETDDRVDYEKQRARDLLIEFVGASRRRSLGISLAPSPELSCSDDATVVVSSVRHLIETVSNGDWRAHNRAGLFLACGLAHRSITLAGFPCGVSASNTDRVAPTLMLSRSGTAADHSRLLGTLSDSVRDE